MYQKTLKQWLWMTAAIMIAAVGLGSSVSYAATCECGEAFPAYTGSGNDCGYASMCRSIVGTNSPRNCTGTEHTDSHKCTVTDGETLTGWDCTMKVSCPGTTPTQPKVPGTLKTKPSGVSESETPKVGDPISAGGGEYREYGTLLSLGGGFIPLGFTLGYVPDIDAGTPTSDGRVQFPPSDAIKAFTSNTVMRLVEFTDKSITPNTDYINILMFDDLLVFRYDSGTARFLPIGPVKYQLEKKSSGYYYLMNPDNGLVYIFGSRALDYSITSPARQIKRVGEIMSVLDRNGSRISYTYNSDYLPTVVEEYGTGRRLNLNYVSGNLSSVADGFGRTASFVYQTLTCGGVSVNTLTGVVDPMSQQTTFDYDTSTNPCYLIKKINRPMGNSNIDQTWTTNPKGVKGISSQKDAYGNQTTLSWTQDASGNLITAVNNPDGTQQTFHHEAERYPLDLKDATGKTANMGYTADNQMSQITDRMGDTTSMTYHAASGKLASFTNAKNQIITYTYAAQSQTFTNPANSETASFTFYLMTRADYPDGTNEQYAYDTKGNLTSRTDQTGKTWAYTYNAKGQVLTATNPAGGVVTHTYNADGTSASSKDSETGTTTYAYDTYKRLNRITHPDGKSVQIAYNANDRVTSITDENNRTYSYSYDSNDNLIRVTDPAGKSVQYAYDLMDRVNRTTDRLGKSSSVTFDSMGRTDSATDPTGVKAEYDYDSRGWLNKITQNGNIWQYGYDDEGVVSSSKTPLNNQTNYQTDKLGAMSSIKDPSGGSLSFTRDAMNRITGITDASDRTTDFSYNAAGLLSGVTLPVVGTASYTRNDIGAVTKIGDLLGSDWTFTYSGMGRLTSLTDPLTRKWQYGYDTLGRMNQLTFPDSSTRTVSFDSAGNVTARTFSAGPVLQFGYDALDRLVSANNLTLTRDAEGRITNTSDSTASFGAGYDDAGRLKTVTCNNLFTVTYSYNAGTGLLDSVTDSLSNTLIRFTYNADRKLTGITRPNAADSTFDYDAAGRVVRIREGNFIDISYTLDAAGQVTDADMAVVPIDPYQALAAGTENFTYNAASQVSTSGYSYDAQGRMTVSPGAAYTWDGASRLTGIGNVNLSYNGMGDLLTRNDGTGTIRYFYNYAIGLNPIAAEKNEAGSFLRYYVWTPGGQLLYMIDAANSNKVYHYHFDRTGSTLALTDSTGAVTDKFAYDPYGRILQKTGTNPQPFTFVGQYGCGRKMRLFTRCGQDIMTPRPGISSAENRSGLRSAIRRCSIRISMPITIRPGLWMLPGLSLRWRLRLRLR